MKIDHSLFPVIDKGYLIIPQPCEQLRPFEDIYDRFCSAIYMASNIDGKSSKYILSDDASNRSYFRAALAEFVSIEDSIRQQYQKIDPKNYKIYESNNSLFHLMKLLRNYNTHISKSHLSNKAINVSTEINPENTFEANMCYVDNIDLQTIKILRSAKHYSDSDLKNMIKCFEREQRKFGVAALIIRGIILYSETIANLLTKEEKQHQV